MSPFCMSKWQDSEVTVHAPVVLLWETVKCIMIISLSSLCFSALYIFEICTHFLQTVLMYCAIKDVRLLTHMISVHCRELKPQAATGDNFIHPTRWNWFERLVNWKTQEGTWQETLTFVSLKDHYSKFPRSFSYLRKPAMVTQDLFGHACASVFARRPGRLADWQPGPASCANKRCPRWSCAHYGFDLRRLRLLAEMRNIRDFLGQEAPMFSHYLWCQRRVALSFCICSWTLAFVTGDKGSRKVQPRRRGSEKQPPVSLHVASNGICSVSDSLHAWRQCVHQFRWQVFSASVQQKWNEMYSRSTSSCFVFSVAHVLWKTFMLRLIKTPQILKKAVQDGS